MKKLLAFMGIFCLIVPLVFLGCEGDDGATGAPGTPGTPGEPGPPGITGTVEQCAVCHSKTGDELQADYDELYQDGVIQVKELTVTYVDNETVTSTFTMTKNGAPFDCQDADSLGLRFVPYTDNNTFTEEGSLSLLPSGSSGSTEYTFDSITGECTATATFADNVADFSGENGLAVLYGTDEIVGTLPARVRQGKFPFAALEIFGTVDYVSAANSVGCEKCHTMPFLKHGYIYGEVADVADSDFLTCKACHFDDREGGHLTWQLMVDDPPLWASGVEDNVTKAKYAYKAKLMNDVHMSHAMEFPYPQSMSNCVVCHEGKLDQVLTADNFVLETCRSCHPLDGSTEYSGGIAGAGYQAINPAKPWERPAATATFALANIIPHAWDLTTNCAGCHVQGGLAQNKLFSDIHTGYDKKIYAVEDNVAKYSDAIVVTIDSASFDNNVLSFAFSATGTAGGLTADDIVPTVMVGLYGWDTKDYIVGPHERDADRNRLLEYTPGGSGQSPHITLDNVAAGSWEVTADLSTWADLIAADNVTKVEIAIMPALENPDFVNPDNTVGLVALNAPSRTFDLGANDFVDNYFQGDDALVRVEDGCNECHAALATTFHSPNRGGNIVVCRLCHITRSGGSHLEMQSRSIDSYAHAIHSFQAFDIDRIDFSDPVYALHYEEHIEFPYPKHGIRDCDSCHNAGKFNAPDQAKSMPGLLSPSEDTLTNWVRNITGVPEYVTGPGTRACGACHRTHAIIEDSPGELEVLNSHWKTNGYLEENDENDTVLYQVIDRVMSIFYP